MECFTQLAPPSFDLLYKLAQLLGTRVVRLGVHVGKHLVFDLALKVTVEPEIVYRKLVLLGNQRQRLRVGTGDREHVVSHLVEDRDPFIDLQRDPVDTTELTTHDADAKPRFCSVCVHFHRRVLPTAL